MHFEVLKCYSQILRILIVTLHKKERNKSRTHDFKIFFALESRCGLKIQSSPAFPFYQLLDFDPPPLCKGILRNEFKSQNYHVHGIFHSEMEYYANFKKVKFCLLQHLLVKISIELGVKKKRDTSL